MQVCKIIVNSDFVKMYLLSTYSMQGTAEVTQVHFV